jgi:hypothetical protein
MTFAPWSTNNLIYVAVDCAFLTPPPKKKKNYKTTLLFWAIKSELSHLRRRLKVAEIVKNVT